MESQILFPVFGVLSFAFFSRFFRNVDYYAISYVPDCKIQHEVMFLSHSSLFKLDNLRVTPLIESKHISYKLKVSEYIEIPNKYFFQEPTTSKYLLYPSRVYPHLKSGNATMIVLKNLYFVHWKWGYNCGFFNNTHLVMCSSYANYSNLLMNYSNYSYAGFYDKLICIGEQNIHKFGHYIVNVLCPLMVIPKDIRDISQIVVPSYNHFSITFLSLIGFNQSQFVVLGANDFVFVGTIYTVIEPTVGANHYSTFLINLSKTLKSKLNISNVIPIKYALHNRKPGTRHFQNFDELCKLLNSTYPQYEWEVIESEYHSLYEASQVWSQIKFLFASSGSHLCNMLFMQKHTGMLVGESEHSNQPISNMARALEIFYYSFSVKGMKHFQKTKVNLDLNLTIRCFNQTLFALHNGYFSGK